MIVNRLPKRCARVLPARCLNLADESAAPAVIEHRDLAAILKIQLKGAGVAASEIEGFHPVFFSAFEIISFESAVAGDFDPATGASLRRQVGYAKRPAREIYLHVTQSLIGMINELDCQAGLTEIATTSDYERENN